ncbi:MAG: DNA-binding protein [Candidatus Kuenenia stuttgartiensis]|nr:DNA-binding protein [Candidatus Kuenenia stuttgartiensis]
MKKISVIVAIVVIVTTSMLTESFSQPKGGMKWKGSCGWSTSGQYGRLFDPATVETLHGEVTNVDIFIPQKGMSGGVHLTLKTDKGEIPVHLGPAWYIENQEIAIEQNDMIEVKGSRINFEGKPAIIAANVRKGDAVLTLRDEKGTPVWSGWRRK